MSELISDKIISNTSYTEKDFNTIYPAILDLVKKICNSWDPSQSNESDPGVVLLKLACIMADKNDYNIDQNILECFPLSVSQENNARNLYEELGYNMKWYMAAESNEEDIGFLAINTKLFPDENGQTQVYSIPRFTLIADSNKEIVYTTLQEVDLENTSTIVYAPCIQGTYKDYSINGEQKISTNSLDSQRRLYFTDRYVAENGIYIVEDNDANKTNDDIDFFKNTWQRVDNLTSYPSNNRVYKFGITADETCYVEFPEDVSVLAKQGLRIRYIITNGESGNIKSNTLTTFLNDIHTNDGESVANDYIKIVQNNAITSGENPETIDAAYTNYKKTIGTFNTLVTRRDYENFIKRTEEVSNCIVSDRTNDINYSNHIKVWGPLYSTDKLVVKTKDTGNEPYMSAYQIYLYLCKLVKNVNSQSTYEDTFKADLDTVSLLSIQSDIEDVKAVQHDITTPEDTSAIFNYNNKYKIKGTIYTQYKVTDTEKKEIEKNIRQNLMIKFNSKELEYGTELDYEKVTNAIKESDSRIKYAIVTEFTYDTQERTFSNNENKLVNKDDYSKLNEIVARMVLSGNVQLYDFDDEFTFEFGQTDIQTYNDIAYIGTEVTIDHDNAKDGYTLKENEVVEVWAENYIQTKNFGAYCEITEINESSSIEANKYYTLTKTMKIKTTEGEQTLLAGDIVKSNVRITSPTPASHQKLGATEYIGVYEKNQKTIVSGTKYLAILNEENYTIKPGDSIILKENEYIVIPDSTNSDLVIFRTGTKIEVPKDATQEIIIYGTTIDTTKIVKENIADLEWNYLTGDINTIQLTITSLGAGTEITVNFLGQTTLNINNTPQEISKINYKLLDGTQGALETSTLQPYYIRSRLNINSVIGIPQRLYENQTFTFYNSNGAQIGEQVAGGDNKYIQFNSNVVLAGDSKLSVTVLDLEESTLTNTLSAYVYVSGDMVDKDLNITRQNGVIKLQSPEKNKKFTLNYDFSDKNYVYLLPIYINNITGDITVTSSIWQSGTTNSTKFTTDNAQQSFILNPTIENITITFTNSGDSVSIGQIDRIEKDENNLKYNEEEINYKDLQQDYDIKVQANNVIEKMKGIDLNNIFNWCYKVQDTDKVLYPTAPSSFWNTNHICNKYTIPMIDFNNFSVTVNSTSIQ